MTGIWDAAAYTVIVSQLVLLGGTPPLSQLVAAGATGNYNISSVLFLVSLCGQQPNIGVSVSACGRGGGGKRCSVISPASESQWVRPPPTLSVPWFFRLPSLQYHVPTARPVLSCSRPALSHSVALPASQCLQYRVPLSLPLPLPSRL